MNKPLSQDPQFQQLLALAKAPVTRRTLLAGVGAGAMVSTLAACAPAGEEVIWDNWPYYMDDADNPQSPTIKGFQDASGIHVTYNLKIEDNNTYFASIKNQLAAGKDTGADTFCLTDWMAGRLIDAGYVKAFDYALMPNVSANFNDAFKTTFADFDPGRKYSITWKGIVAAVGYNKKLYKEITGQDAPTDLYKDILDNPKLKGKVEVLAEMRDTLGVMMAAKGIDPASFTKNDFENTLNDFKKYVANGQIRGIKGNSYVDDFLNGDAVAGIVWAGDMVGANLEQGNDNLGVVLLESGSTFACDNFMIPNGAVHAENAHKLIDYYFDPEVAAALALGGVNYVTPVNGAKEAAMAKDPNIGSNPLIFPSDEDYATKFKVFRSLTPAEDNEWSTAWSDASNGVA